MLHSRRIAALILLFVMAAIPVAARPEMSSRGKFSDADLRAPVLADLLTVQRARYPDAVVTSGFYDWRTVSQYRSRAGLHLGYDIAMPAGSPAVTGWGGTVVSVAQWTGAEHGVTILHPSGYETTYGHLRPSVEVGQQVRMGEVVGYVARDHVDVKMRGPDGLYFDFGNGTPGIAGPLPAIPTWLTKEELLRQYLTAQYTVADYKDQADLALSAQRRAQSELDRERKAVKAARTDVPQLEKYYVDGLIARVDLEAARKRVGQGGTRVSQMQRRVRTLGEDLGRARMLLGQARARLESTRASLRAMGVTVSEIQSAMRRMTKQGVADAARLKALQKKTLARHAAQKKHNQKALAEAKVQVQRMDRLYEQGAVSREERDNARRRFEELGGEPTSARAVDTRMGSPEEMPGAEKN